MLQNLALEGQVSPFLLTGEEQNPLGNTYFPRARGHLHLEMLSLLLGSPGPSGGTRMDPPVTLGPFVAVRVGDTVAEPMPCSGARGCRMVSLDNEFPPGRWAGQ